MSSITANANPERTNRWLLIGAVASAAVFGILVFVALANFGDSGTSTSPTSTGNTSVLVARQTIQPNTKITAAMFETTSVAGDSLVDGYVSDPEVVLGKVTRTIVLKGEQISINRIGSVDGKNKPGFIDTIPPGMRAVAIGVTEEKAVAGLLTPGDRVDIVATFKESRGQGEITRVETVLQNVELLALAQGTLDPLPSLNAEGTPVTTDSAEGSLGARPTDSNPEPTARTATLALTPEDVQKLLAAKADGELTLVARPPAESQILNLTETNHDSFGFVGPLPRP